MFKKLTLKRFLDLAKSEDKIAVYREITADKITPISAYCALSKDCHNMSLLESCDRDSFSRYSYLFLGPYHEFTSDTNNSTNHFHRAQEYFNEYGGCHYEHPMSRYAGAAVGFISYDAIRFIEEISDTNEKEIDLPDLFFRSYRTCITFDHTADRAIISTVVDVNKNPKIQYEIACQTIKSLIAKINISNPRQTKPDLQPKTNQGSETISDVSDEQYIKMVEKAKQYIVDGDAFQVVLSRTFKKNYTAKPFDIYRSLRLTNPSAYMFYLEYNDFTIIGASPEKLVSVKEDVIETNPIAGTRPRGKTKQKDLFLEKELLQDEKEIAEHMMLVDLGCNDLGAVSVPGSVKVKKLKEIQRLSQVMHIASLVEGKLAPNKNIIDAIKAVFPAGTLSGAPKIRAMNIIDELETKKRGLYGGAICITDGRQNLDACIAIRMAILNREEKKAYIRAGAGVVFDSDPQKEADETRHKAKAVISAIDLAEGGLQ